MYLPEAFAETRLDVVAAFMVAHPFAQLVTMSDQGLFATPVPMLLGPYIVGLGSPVGHVGRANPQWRRPTSCRTPTCRTAASSLLTQVPAGS